ncbi:MAG: RNA pseudouridine synthase, partial [Desulfobacterales bacterium]
KALFPDCLEQPSVHRLDMATSGLMVLARTKSAHRDLSIQFEQRAVVKRYEALVLGQVEGEQGMIDLPFRLDPDNRPYQVYDEEHGKRGVTHWKALRRDEHTTRLEFFPHTGRTHQLRLHASHAKGLGCPIVGDALYGTGRDGEQMFLHATGLQITHPESKEVLCFFSPPPF